MKKDLLTRMINIYGFEHEVIPQFKAIMDTTSEDVLETIVKAHEAHPVELEVKTMKKYSVVEIETGYVSFEGTLEECIENIRGDIFFEYCIKTPEGKIYEGYKTS